VERDDWNNWNFGTLGTDVNLKRLELSAAVERLERFEHPSVCVRVAFHAEKTRSKPPDRAIYTVFYRLINDLRRSDPEPVCFLARDDPWFQIAGRDFNPIVTSAR
jgi:hypothetical protein